MIKNIISHNTYYTNQNNSNLFKLIKKNGTSINIIEGTVNNLYSDTINGTSINILEGTFNNLYSLNLYLDGKNINDIINGTTNNTINGTNIKILEGTVNNLYSDTINGTNIIISEGTVNNLYSDTINGTSINILEGTVNNLYSESINGTNINILEGTINNLYSDAIFTIPNESKNSYSFDNSINGKHYTIKYNSELFDSLNINDNTIIKNNENHIDGTFIDEDGANNIISHYENNILTIGSIHDNILDNESSNDITLPGYFYFIGGLPISDYYLSMVNNGSNTLSNNNINDFNNNYNTTMKLSSCYLSFDYTTSTSDDYMNIYNSVFITPRNINLISGTTLDNKLQLILPLENETTGETTGINILNPDNETRYYINMNGDARLKSGEFNIINADIGNFTDIKIGGTSLKQYINELIDDKLAKLPQ